MPEDRRHIAVMFTDIVGYTALMGTDEDKAFDPFQKINFPFRLSPPPQFWLP